MSDDKSKTSSVNDNILDLLDDVDFMNSLEDEYSMQPFENTPTPTPSLKRKLTTNTLPPKLSIEINSQQSSFSSSSFSSSSFSMLSSNNGGKTRVKLNAIKSKQPSLSCAVKQGHDLYFSTETHFFGCYWRNKSSSLCGFPTAQGLDYVTFQAQNRNQSTFTKTVVVGFEIDAETRSKYQTFIFKTELNPFRDLPDNDNSLIGNIGSFADTMKPFSFYVAVPASEAIAIAIPPVKSTTSNSPSTSTASTPKKYKISVNITPNKWTLVAKMGNVKIQKKLEMIHTPVTEISKSIIPTKNLSCLNIIVYGTKKSCQTFTGLKESKKAARGTAKMTSEPMSPRVVASSNKKALHIPTLPCMNTKCEILGVLRSPAFVIGSSRSLRNTNKKGSSSQSKKREVTSKFAKVIADVKNSRSSVAQPTFTNAYDEFQSLTDGTVSADSISPSLSSNSSNSSNDETDSRGHSREHSPLLTVEEAAEIAGFVDATDDADNALRPNKRARLNTTDIMPIEMLISDVNNQLARNDVSVGFDKQFATDYRMMSAKPDNDSKHEEEEEQEEQEEQEEKNEENKRPELLPMSLQKKQQQQQCDVEPIKFSQKRGSRDSQDSNKDGGIPSYISSNLSSNLSSTISSSSLIKEALLKVPDDMTQHTNCWCRPIIVPSYEKDNANLAEIHRNLLIDQFVISYFVLISLSTGMMICCLSKYMLNDLRTGTRATPVTQEEIFSSDFLMVLNWIIETSLLFISITLGCLIFTDNHAPNNTPVKTLFSMTCCGWNMALMPTRQHLWKIHSCILKFLTPIFLYLTLTQMILPFVHTSGQCFEYPCYAAPSNTSLTDKCTLCTKGENFCPNTDSVVMNCYAEPSEEFPRLCGMKNCHISDDCRIGGGADQKFLGFPTDSDLCHNTFRVPIMFGVGSRFLFAVVMSWLADSLSQGQISKQDMEYYPHLFSWMIGLLIIWFGSRILIFDIVFDIFPWNESRHAVNPWTSSSNNEYSYLGASPSLSVHP